MENSTATLSVISDLPGWQDYRSLVQYLAMAFIIIGFVGWNALPFRDMLLVLLMRVHSGLFVWGSQPAGWFLLLWLQREGFSYWLRFLVCLALPVILFIYHEARAPPRSVWFAEVRHLSAAQRRHRVTIKLTKIYCAVMWCVFGALFESALLAFMGVGAFFAACGFFVIHLPGVTWIGFEEEWWVPTSAVQSAMVICSMMGLLISGRSLGVFSVAFQFWGALVHCLAMVCWASARYDDKRPLPLLVMVNFAALASFLALSFCAVAWFPHELPTMRSIVSACFWLFLAEKWTSLSTWSNHMFLMLFLTGVALIVGVNALDFVSASGVPPHSKDFGGFARRAFSKILDLLFPKTTR